MVDIKRSIRRAIAERGYENTHDFCHKTGLNYMSVRHWYTSGRRPSLDNLERLAEALDMRLSEFIALGESEK